MTNYSSIFEYLDKLVKSGKLPSAVFGVADSNGVLALDSFGAQVADAYLLWSVTKPVVGLAMMQMWERGLINLNHEVKQYLPWFGANRSRRT